MSQAGSGLEFHVNFGSGRVGSLHLWVGLGRVKKTGPTSISVLPGSSRSGTCDSCKTAREKSQPLLYFIEGNLLTLEHTLHTHAIFQDGCTDLSLCKPYGL